MSGTRPNRIAVDVTAPGIALIVAGGRQARVGRDGGRFYVEDVDSEEIIGYARSYKQAGKIAARAWGFDDVPIELDRE